jgi:hypothetical protein
MGRISQRHSRGRNDPPLFLTIFAGCWHLYSALLSGPAFAASVISPLRFTSITL